jgi:cysteine desulfurase / selenocysteine lyase
MTGQALVPKTRFIGGDERAYLYTAGEGLVPASALDATRRYFEDKVRAGSGRAAHTEVERTCRSALARLLGDDVAADEIALLGSSSEGINAVYQLIDWQPGDNLVTITNDLEFPSVVLPAARLTQSGRGVEVRAVPHDGWVIEPDEIAAAVDARTRLVILSHVSYRTGFRHDLEAVGAAIRARNPGVIFAVDATQSLGVVPVAARACDFLVVTSCKWLLGPHGLGVFFWNRERQPDVEPASIGWYSVVDDLRYPYDLKPDAGRFELGGPNLLSIYALLEGVNVLLEVGVDRIEPHVIALGARLLDALRPLDLPVITPDDPQLRAGIVAWLDVDPPATAVALAEQGVVVTGSSGRIRAGIHLYNDASDVDRLAKALRAITIE